MEEKTLNYLTNNRRQRRHLFTALSAHARHNIYTTIKTTDEFRNV